MYDIKFMSQWQADEEFAFQGWDFSQMEGRWDCPEPPWNYRLLVKSYLKDKDTLLDMGTGGGEVLRTIGHPCEKTYVTEAYVPNLELCKRELSPLGITVAQTFDDDKLPFEEGKFDFIINRHESFDLTEVDRVLKHGGYFFTQQVGNKNSADLMQRLNDGYISHSSNHTIGQYTNTLEQLGFQILLKDESIYPVKFYDMGALIFYAKVCEWEFPHFSVSSHYEKLYACHQEMEQKGFLQTTGHRFMIGARKI